VHEIVKFIYMTRTMLFCKINGVDERAGRAARRGHAARSIMGVN
jgi:hypothetical protein